MIALEWVHDRIRADEFYFSRHGDQERQNENLTVTETIEALLVGIALEQYKDTGRGECCLIAGFTRSGVPVHAVCGRRGEHLAIVTVYVPTAPKFKNPYERG